MDWMNRFLGNNMKTQKVKIIHEIISKITVHYGSLTLLFLNGYALGYHKFELSYLSF